MSHQFTEIVCEQRTAQWYAARAGRLTASAAKYMLSSVKTGEAAARRDLRVRLVVERLTSCPEDDGNGFTNAAIQWGIDHEEEAIDAYQTLTGNLVTKSGFLAHNEWLMGASLDGHVDNYRGCVEVKAPKSATHFGYLRGPAELPAEHRPQVLHQMLVTGAEWCDFLSFDPRMPPHMRTFYVRYLRDEGEIAAYAEKAVRFLAECEREYQIALGWHAVEAVRA